MTKKKSFNIYKHTKVCAPVLPERIPTKPEDEVEGRFSPTDPRFLLRDGRWDQDKHSVNIMVDDTHVTFYGISEDGTYAFEKYWIDFPRLRNQDELIHWVQHLLLKPWVSKNLIRGFIDQVCKKKGWPRYGGVS